jgi:hypothetical protein
VLDGYRRFVVSSPYSPFTAHCFEIVVSAPSSTDTLERVVFTRAVRFDYPAPTDSARFDIVIGGSGP